MDTTDESIVAAAAPPATVVLAQFCKLLACLPQTAHGAVRRTLLDTLGVAAAGAQTTGGRASRQASAQIWGRGEAPVWFSRQRLTPAGAAFVNATYAAALDLDDGHRLAAGHPAAAIVPAVVAVAGQIDCRADQLLTAIALGYEVAVRISAARDIKTIRTTDTGLWCGAGVAAAAAWLSGQSAPVIAHAIAIAAQTATSQAATGWTKLGHTVKEGIPWATANGIAAVSLASAGHRGPVDILDDPMAYCRHSLLEDLGQSWAIERAYFKLYSCCRWAHAAIDGALALQARHAIIPEQIEGMRIETFGRALTLPNQPEPQSVEAAQYSIPFCVALSLVHGERALLPMDERYLADTRVHDLAKRITLSSASAYAEAFPAMTPARATIAYGGLIKSIEVLFPRGEPQNPLDASELHDKFAILSTALGKHQVSAIAQAVEGIGTSKTPSALFAALATPT